jgi:hypothetical protein
MISRFDLKGFRVQTRRMAPPAKKPAIGSYEDAELVQIHRVARLTPAKRVALACSMGQIIARVQRTRKQAPQSR